MKPIYFNDLINLCTELSIQENKLLPLCAAENVLSPFSKIPLDTFLQEKYIMGMKVILLVAKNYINYMSYYRFNVIIYMDVNMLMHVLYPVLMLL